LARAAWFLVLLCLLLAVFELVSAGRSAQAGRHALDRATAALKARQVDAGQADLEKGAADFAAAHRDLGRLGPVGWLAKVTPLVRVQLRATQTLVDSGQQVARAGLQVTPLARAVLAPRTGGRSLPVLTAEARKLLPDVDRAASEIAEADRRVAALDDYRLVWPISSARRSARTRLDDASRKVSKALHGLRVGLEVAGADGPKSFLVLSQNPDEVRPTGGYMGTYGLLTSNRGELRLARYGAMGSWTDSHPAADIPAAKAPYPFRYASPPQPQTLANVNMTPDWPASARKAADLWQRGGEQPVDGVLTFTPALLIRLVGALGQVRVAGYPDVITAGNVDARLEYYTHREAVRDLGASVRKQFIADLAQAVFHAALTAPSGRFPKLGTALSGGLDQRDTALWLRPPSLEADLAAAGWDGGFRARPGDFFADAEFAFVSKNGRGLRRTFTHSVALRPDGSGTADTALKIHNTLPFESGGYNDNPIYYLTPYGPQGAVLDKVSDPPDAPQPALAGHPSAAWFRTVAAKQTGTLHLRWDAPELAVRRTDGLWEFRLTWLPTPGHVGDALDLSVTLPSGWRWRGASPPHHVALNDLYEGRWLITPGHTK
jgi:hypothetical protein